MKKSKLDKVAEHVKSMYWQEGRTTDEIGDIYNLDATSVQRWLKDNGGIRPTGPIKAKVTADDEERMPNGALDQYTDKDSATSRGSSDKGDVYDDLCKDILEQFHSKRIGKQEAQLKWMFLSDEFEELGQLDFDRKYMPQVNKAPRS